MKIWLDDQLNDPAAPGRHTPEGWVGASNFEEFRALIEQALENKEQIEVIDFDNDLGTDPEGRARMEGNKILEWLKDTYPEYIVSEKTELRVHSKNIVENEKMRRNIETWRRNSQEILEAKDRPNPWGEIERG